MLNRYLSLLVAVVAPASAAVLLIAGAHPIGEISWAERAPSIGLAIAAAILAVMHLRAAPAGAARAEAAMWCGLSIFFFVATFAWPQLGLSGIVAVLLLAATSVSRLIASHRRSATRSPFRRRIFA